MKSAKTKILRLIFRKAEPERQKDERFIIRQQHIASPCQSSIEDVHIASEDIRSLPQQEDGAVDASAPFQQITPPELGDLFPGDLEALYEQPAAAVKRRRIRCGDTENEIIIGTNGTSFLDLPREVRNEIYYYAVVSPDRVWTIRKSRTRKQHNNKDILERLPQLCRAIPLYTEEVLKTHYEYNTLRFSSFYGNGPFQLLDWIHRRGSDLVKSIRHVQIVHRYDSGPYISPHWAGHITTRIKQLPNHTIEATCNYARPEYACHCGIAELVQERLLRSDAQADAECVRRIETSTVYGPVLGFALQLLEAVRLTLVLEPTYHGHGRPFSEMRRLWPEVPELCILCGKRNWAFRY